MKLQVQHHLTTVIESSPEDLAFLKKRLKIYSPVFKSESEFPFTVTNLFNPKEQTFPTPYLSTILEAFKKAFIDVEVKDQRVYKAPHLKLERDETNVLPLMRHQKEAMDALKPANTGIIASATGSGKTRIIEEIILLRRVKTLVIVPSISVRTGMYNDLAKAFGKKMVSAKYPKRDEQLPEQKNYTPQTYFNVSGPMDRELQGGEAEAKPMSKLEERLARSKKKEEPKRNVIGGGLAEFYGQQNKNNEEAYLKNKGWTKDKGRWGKQKIQNKPSRFSMKPKNLDGASITVVCFQALPELNEEFLKSIEMVIVDECHHGSAETIRDALVLMKSAGYRYGLSATPWRDKSDENKLLKVALGDNFLFDLQGQEAVERGIIAAPDLRIVTSPQPDEWLRDYTNWRMVVEKGIIGNRTRNNAIINQAIDLMSNNHNVFICVDEIAHLDILKQRLKDEHNVDALIIHGQQNKVKNQELVEKVGKHREAMVSIGTMAVGEGTNMPAISAVIIAAPGKSSVRFLQRIGRGTRILEDKKSVIVIDFEDWFNPILMRHSRQRQKIFRNYFGIE